MIFFVVIENINSFVLSLWAYKNMSCRINLCISLTYISSISNYVVNKFGLHALKSLVQNFAKFY